MGMNSSTFGLADGEVITASILARGKPMQMWLFMTKAMRMKLI